MYLLGQVVPDCFIFNIREFLFQINKLINSQALQLHQKKECKYYDLISL